MSENTKADAIYWIWLQSALGIGVNFKRMTDKFGSAKAIYEAGDDARKASGVFTRTQLANLRKADIDDAKNTIYTCEKYGWQILCFDDGEYPQIFREIDCPPEVLYIDGKLPDIKKELALAVIGSRNASDYGTKTAELFGRAVAQAGAVLVSGGAYGIDVHAHNGALDAGGKTVVVMGSGLGVDYPKRNEYMRRRARESGALITEIPPFQRAVPALFPLRNRLISALSRAVLVIEANERSGSLSTVNHALGQNVDVFVIPCSILDSKFSGTNKLIRDGAAVATCPLDFIAPYAAEYGIDIDNIKSVPELLAQLKKDSSHGEVPAGCAFEKTAETRKARERRNETVSALSGNEFKVASVMSSEFLSVDEIVAKSALPVHIVSSVLVGLEIQGIVRSANANRYKLS
ncbi:MAG: DNA-processing protein DprA [Clostridiales bacterium]|nr:DNA-processing protein DprA [Clostridiales bacterium]